MDYILTASKAVLHTGAVYREKFLYGRYQMGKDVIARFEKEPPYAWIIPRQQWDVPTAALLLNKMIAMGIEVYESEQAFASDGISHPAGTWVIPMNQPFSLFVKSIFEEQRFPDLAKSPNMWQGLVRPQSFGDAYIPPYDIAGWTLPYQMGVAVTAADSPVEAPLALLETVTPPAGRVEGDVSYAYLLDPRTNNSFIAANRILQVDGEILRARGSVSVGAKSYPPGALIVLSSSISRSLMDSLAEELFLSIDGIKDPLPVETFKLNAAPRVALYKSWVASMDEGWTRWLFEQFEFPFTSIDDSNVMGGELAQRFDVIVIPSMSTEEIVDGHRSGTVPPQYVGGMTTSGVRNVRRFVEEGGTLVTLNESSLFAMQSLGLPVSNALEKAKPPEFGCPKSLLRMSFDVSHPIAYGMPEEAPAVFVGSPAFEVLDSSAGEEVPRVIARYPHGSLLMSGYLKGEEFLQNKASVLEVPLGKGRVILLGFGVQSTAQPHGTFKLLFNSVYWGAARQ